MPKTVHTFKWLSSPKGAEQIYLEGLFISGKIDGESKAAAVHSSTEHAHMFGKVKLDVFRSHFGTTKAAFLSGKYKLFRLLSIDKLKSN